MVSRLPFLGPRKRGLTGAVLLILFFGLQFPLWARLGGGGGYSGGGGGYSGGGGGSHPPITAKEFFTTMLCLSPLGILMLYRSRNERLNSILIQRVPQKPVDWDVICRGDPNFSHVLFRDFAYTLFAKVHEARGNQNLGRFGQFLSPWVVDELNSLAPGVTDVSGVIVGSLNVSNVKMKGDTIRICLVLDANYTEHFGGRNRSVYGRHTWWLERDVRIKSLPPQTISALDCLECGSSFMPAPEGQCAHCGEYLEPGKHHWMISHTSIGEQREVGPTLTTSVPDVGLNLPTLYAQDYHVERERFERKHPEFKFEAMTYRFRHIFFELQEAWSAQDLDRLRPFETDSLFQNHSYWVREYQKQGLHNELSQVRIQNLEVVKFRSDKYYDAVTCRIFASMTDCTRWVNGNIACGNPSLPKQFSEYWTFVRGRGAVESKEDDSNCPNCGAELKINMAGECEYCDSKLTSGQFDWVLSEIQQDEEYGG